MKGILCHVGKSDRIPDLLVRNIVSVFYVFCQLFVPVLVCIPVEQRIVKWNSENMFRVVGVLDDERIALYDGAHPLAGLLLIFRLHGGDGWHKDPVHMHFREAADMAVDKLCREAHRVRGHRVETFLVELVAAGGGYADCEA